jgi:hypothetical protein
MIKLLSAIPNSILSPGDGFEVLVSSLSDEDVKTELSKNKWESCVGHDSTAKLFSEKLGLDIQFNRQNIILLPNEALIVGMFTPPRRLGEGEVWTEEEILAMPINWVRVVKYPKGYLVAVPSVEAIV